MTALPAVVPGAQLRLVGSVPVTAAAATAASVDPATLIRTWLATKSASARRAYSLAVRTFGAWAVEGEATPERVLAMLCGAGVGRAHALLEGWREHMLGNGLATGTVAGRLSAIASLVRCARRAGLAAFTIENVAPRVEPVCDRSGPTLGEIDRLLQVIDDAAEKGRKRAVRDAAIVRLLFCCGFRRAEVVGLQVEHVDLAAGAVMPRRKGKRARAPVTVSPATIAALSRWLDVRGSEPGPVFVRSMCADDVTPLSGESVRRSLRSWAKAAGMQKLPRPHGMRHAGATILAERGDLACLMAYGGWSSLSAASRYLDKRESERRRALDLLDR